MITAAKIEQTCARKHDKGISVDDTVRACINCAWYEQYHRKNRGNVYGWVGIHIGYCLKHNCQHNALHQACQHFERKGSSDE